MEKMLRALAQDLEEPGQLDLTECFIDGTFAGAKKGALSLDRRSAARGRRSWRLPTALVFLSPYPSQVLPLEVTLVESTLDQRLIRELPERLIGDNAYDSDPLDARLARERGIGLIAPHRSTRIHLTQDNRPHRRYTRRWTIERRFACLPFDES
jgi:hypothetical protein